MKRSFSQRGRNGHEKQRRERQEFQCPHCEKPFRKEQSRNDHAKACPSRVEVEAVTQ